MYYLGVNAKLKFLGNKWMSEEGSNCLKAVEAGEQRKLTSGVEPEVGVMNDHPRYLALLRGGRGVPREESWDGTRKNGAQCGQSQVL